MYGAAVSHDRQQSCPLVSAWLLGLLSIFGCFLGCSQGPQVREDSHMCSSSRARPIDVDPANAEKIGQEALEKIGYEEIINLSEKAGFVERKLNLNVQLASNGPIVAAGFVRVFSRYAFAAAVTSQADSPLPGPADIAAVGIIVIGLVDAGLLDGYLIKSVGTLIGAAGEAAIPGPVTAEVPGNRGDCRAHLIKCMETSPSRSRPGSGSHPKQSICVDCWFRCNGEGRWPDKIGDGKDCHWWDGR